MGSDLRGFTETTISRISKYASWVLALLSLAFTIYLGFFKKNEPKLEYDIVSSTTFINNKESTAYLKILIDTIDVQESHLNVSAFNIKIENRGSANISNLSYDKGFFGLIISNGKLLELPTLLEASNEHIKHQFPSIDSLEDVFSVPIPEITLDVDDYYIIRVVLIHNIDSVPSFRAEGKIVGQKEIIVNGFMVPEPNFWAISFGGNWMVQLVRFFAYLLVLFVVIVVIIVADDTIDKIKSKRIRKRKIKELEKRNCSVPQLLKNDYIKNGAINIIWARKIYKKSEIDITSEYKKSKEFIRSYQVRETNNRKEYENHSLRFRSISELIEIGYLMLKDDDRIVFNKEIKRAVLNMYPYMKALGMLNSSQIIRSVSDMPIESFSSTDTIEESFLSS